ncbi:hypothetical protein KW478_04275 [Vibrio fluvialis]|nr:hypothetical protein [Vibrio fluvialis]
MLSVYAIIIILLLAILIVLRRIANLLCNIKETANVSSSIQEDAEKAIADLSENLYKDLDEVKLTLASINEKID